MPRDRSEHNHSSHEPGGRDRNASAADDAEDPQDAAAADHGDDIEELTRPLEAARADLQAVLEELRISKEKVANLRQAISATTHAMELEKRRYEDLFRTAPDGYLVTDQHGAIRDANDAAADLVGCRREHLRGKPVLVFLPIEERRSLRNTLLQLKSPGESLTLPFSFGRQNGRDPVDLEARVGVSPVVHTEIELRWVLRDITERRRAEHAEKERERLERDNEAKDEFISFLTHELRTPLTIIIGNTEALVRHSQLDDATKAESIEEIRKESKRIHHVVENLLFLAVTNQTRQFEPDFVLLQRLVPGVLADHLKRFPGRTIECRIPQDFRPVHADPVYCEQILQNMLSNAEKYGNDAPIELEATEQDGFARVLMLDRGTGIDEEEAHRLFNLFERGRDVLHTVGAGIGLAVCKRLVEMQGGDIWAKPREGGGSEFGFTLPLAERGAED